MVQVIWIAAPVPKPPAVSEVSDSVLPADVGDGGGVHLLAVFEDGHLPSAA